jgi:deazaflavin-dependent oxidoreductase (nitroreductase family)
MPLPKWLARFNLLVTNRVLGPLARWAPGMGIIIHTGRTSHRQYRTPVMVFRRGKRLLIALTYGPEAQWVQNVLAAGGCELITGNRRLRVAEPRSFHDETRGNMPVLVKFVLGVLNVSDFLELTVEANMASQ